MNVDALLQERAEAPSGEDLEYDPAFTELEIAATPGEERQVGDEIIHAEDPDYKEISQKALEIMERSHDLRAGIFMAEAQLRLKGLPGFAAATAYVRGCLEQYWDSCHPQLDADDDNDPTMRVNAVLSLADTDRILRNLRRAPLTDSRTFGAMSLMHIAVAEGEITPPAGMDMVPDSASVMAAFQDTDDEKLGALADAAAQALADVEAIIAKFDEETPAQGPDLDPLQKMLQQISGRLAQERGSAGGDAADAGDTEAPASPAAAPVAAMGGGAAGGAVGGINSSMDVMNALARIIGYYERCEPSSPVPVLLSRAKTLVNADFLTIVKNMAPGGVENVHLIAGIDESEDEY